MNVKLVVHKFSDNHLFVIDSDANRMNPDI